MLRSLAFLFACLGVLTGGLQPASAETAAPTQVTMAMLAPSALTWLHAVAQERGFYASHGVSVRELRASDSTSLLQAVATGSANAGLSLGDLALRAIDRGAPIVIAGAPLNKAILRLYAAKDIADLKALNGKPVTAGAVRGGTADLLKYQVLKAGGDPASLKMVSIANSRDRITALGNGQIEAALLIAPFDTLADRDGFRLLDTYREPYVETPLVLNRAWATQNRAIATALVQALKQAAAWINDPANRAAAIEVLAISTKSPPDVCAASYDFIIHDQQAIPADFAVTAAGLQNIDVISAAVNSNGADTAPFDLSKYYDPSFVGAR